MLEFIIIEDNKKYQKLYQKIISTIMFNKNKNYELTLIEDLNSSHLLELKNKITYKIFLVNIDNAKNLKFISDLRKHDLDSEIILLTKFKKLNLTIPKIYRVIEKNYLLSQILENDITDIINVNYDDKKFIHIGKQGILQLFLKEIEYVYKKPCERKLVVCTANQNYEVNMSLNKFLDMVDKRFIQIHRACIVNSTKVNFYNWTDGLITFNNNETIKYCSKTYKNNILKSVIN